MVKVQRDVLQRMEAVARDVDMLRENAVDYPTLPAEMLEATLARLGRRVAELFCEQLGLDSRDERHCQGLHSAMLGSIDVDEFLAGQGVEVVSGECGG